MKHIVPRTKKRQNLFSLSENDQYQEIAQQMLSLTVKLQNNILKFDIGIYNSENAIEQKRKQQIEAYIKP